MPYRFMSQRRTWVDTRGNPADPSIALVGDVALDWLELLSVPSLGVRVAAYEGRDYQIQMNDRALTIRSKIDTDLREILSAQICPLRPETLIAQHTQIAPADLERFRFAQQRIWQLEQQRNQAQTVGQPD